MTKRKRFTSRDVNRLLPRALHSQIISDLSEMMKDQEDWKFQYLNREFLSKFVGHDTSPANVRRTRAINKWLACERDNDATNTRLLTVSDNQLIAGIPYGRFMGKVRSIVESVIGAVPDTDNLLLGGFSGGASTSKRRLNAHPSVKYLEKADISSSAIDIFQDLVLSDDMHWKQHIDDVGINVVDYNILFTVPKSTEIDRCAAMEPDLNMYMQKGLGDLIRHGLRLSNIDLNDQTRNQRLARRGSISGDLMTLDLSAASDSMTFELVAQAVPACWFTMLNALRSKFTSIDGDLHENQMFSSMGNGFTFELESLLFYAITKAVAYFRGVRGSISVYGDDIIAPYQLADDLTEWLEFLGFSVNTKKSFSSGPFRESCGAHWFNGIDVTPFYIRRPISTLFDLNHFLNSLLKWSTVSGMVDPRVLPVWEKYKSLIPEYLWGGQDFSDPSSLVTGCLPKKRLFAVKSTVDYGHIGGYLHWLRRGFERIRSGELVTSKGLKDRPRFRLRTNPTVTRISLSFPIGSYYEIQAPA